MKGNSMNVELDYKDEKYDNLELLKQIGDGYCSKVYLCSTQQKQELLKKDFYGQNESDQKLQLFALKVFEKKYQKHLGFNEFQILNKLEPNPHIIKAYQYSMNDQSCPSIRSSQVKIAKRFEFMLMEYCPYNDLFYIIKSIGKLEETLAKSLFLQVLDAVEFLHSKQNIAHLDLKLENILIGDDYILKLCDFGFAQDINKKVYKNQGSEGYKAPEIYLQSEKEGYDPIQADIFALGVLLFILVFGLPPFTKTTQDNVYYRLFRKEGLQATKYWMHHPGTKDKYRNGELNPQLILLLLSLMDNDPSRRPKSIQEIKESPYFKSNTLTLQETGDKLKGLLEYIESLNGQGNIQ